MAQTHGTEIELKLRVDDLAALLRICIASGASPLFTAVQHNRYLDTTARALDAARYVLRVRDEVSPSGTTTFLTVKGPSRKSADGALTHVAEEEVVVTSSTAAGLLDGSVDALQVLLDDAGCTPARTALVDALRAVKASAPLCLIGGFTNERTRLDVTFPEGFAGTLELDRVTFPGDQVHHEVEFEIPAGVDVDAARAAFEALFARARVVGRSAPGKASRFFRALRGERLA